MSEKEQRSTSQPEQPQGFHSPPEGEISLVDLLEVLIGKRVLILAITSICTLFSIFYAQSMTPIYKATIGFLPPDVTSLAAYFPDNIARTLPDEIKYTSSGDVIYKNRAKQKYRKETNPCFTNF